MQIRFKALFAILFAAGAAVAQWQPHPDYNFTVISPGPVSIEEFDRGTNPVYGQVTAPNGTVILLPANRRNFCYSVGAFLVAGYLSQVAESDIKGISAGCSGPDGAGPTECTAATVTALMHVVAAGGIAASAYFAGALANGDIQVLATAATAGGLKRRAEPTCSNPNGMNYEFTQNQFAPGTGFKLSCEGAGNGCGTQEPSEPVDKQIMNAVVNLMLQNDYVHSQFTVVDPSDNQALFRCNGHFFSGGTQDVCLSGISGTDNGCAYEGSSLGGCPSAT